MAKLPPLSVRIYYDPLLTELVRRLGYETLALEAARGRLEPLVEQYGKDRVNAAARAVLLMDEATAQLRPEARKAAWQLLGPPPATVS